MKRIEVNKPFSLNTWGVIFSVAFIYLTYLVLLHDDLKFLSINAVQSSLNHWLKHWQVLTVCLLPMYVGLIFFGAAICGYFVGSYLQRWVK